MFRDDRCTIKRPASTKFNGEIVYGEPIIIAQDIPCHLSVKALSPVNQTRSTATVLLDYVLFIDTKESITINKNDIINITTSKGDIFELRAGESYKYSLTTQTHCEKLEVV